MELSLLGASICGGDERALLPQHWEGFGVDLLACLDEGCRVGVPCGWGELDVEFNENISFVILARTGSTHDVLLDADDGANECVDVDFLSELGGRVEEAEGRRHCALMFWRCEYFGMEGRDSSRHLASLR